jgi:CelD/BcsL family acetyltransferase involved in cellulose biosynthesis
LKQRALLIAAILAWAAAGASAWLWFDRRGLPYNAQGRYFDESTATVLHEQTVTVLAVLAVSLFLLGVLLLAVRRRIQAGLDPA